MSGPIRCRTCGKPVRLRADGTAGVHAGKTGRQCPGSGLPPHGDPPCLPLCVRCMDIGKWTTCPRCGWSVRQDPPGSGVLAPHGGRNWVPCPESGQLAPPGVSVPEAERMARAEHADYTEG